MHLKTKYIDEKNARLAWLNYLDGNIALRILSDDGELVATASVNTDEILPSGYIAIKDYSENEGILDALLDEGIISHPIRWIASGYVKIPVCKILVPHAR
jgi:hypothetical protein